MCVIERDFYPMLSADDRRELENFLNHSGLRYEADIDYACCLTDEREEIRACGCCAGNILKCFAVSEGLRGQNVTGRLTAKLQANRLEKGFERQFVFTGPKNRGIFESCGFYFLAGTGEAVMLENRACGPEHFLEPLREEIKGERREKGRIGAVVMNGNPFTLGHRHLAEYAAERCDLVYLFVVEAECSLFPFAQRLALARAGCAHLANVRVCPGGPYLISSVTFPSYFLKQESDALRVQSELDAVLFAERIAPGLNIGTRFVGQEPLCAATNRYHETLRRVLPRHRIEVEEIPRLTKADQTPISASAVRERLEKEGPGEWLREYVPPSTRIALMSGGSGTGHT